MMHKRMREAVSFSYHEKNCLNLIPHEFYRRDRNHFDFIGKENSNFTDRSYAWYVDYKEKSDDIFIVRGKKIREINSDARKLVAALNAADADPWSFRTQAQKELSDPPKVKLMKVENGAALVQTINAEYLTQRTGSSWPNIILLP